MVITKEELKDIIRECIEEETMTQEQLTESDIDFIRECFEYVGIDETFGEDNFEIDYFEEGANLDMRTIFKKYKADYKECINNAKKDIKEHKYDDAKKETKKAKAIVRKMKKSINSIDSDAWSVLFGFFVGTLVDMTKLLVPFAVLAINGIIFTAGLFEKNDKGTMKSLSNIKLKDTLQYIAFAPIFAYFGAGMSVAGAHEVAKNPKKGIKDIVNKNTIGTFTIPVISSIIATAYSLFTVFITECKNISQFSKDVKDKDVSTANALNKYRSKLIQKIDSLDKAIDNIDKIIDNNEKIYKIKIENDK